MKGLFRIGTRGSKLALWQAGFISQLVTAEFPEIRTEIEVIKTTGDVNLESPLAEIGGKGVFVKEIEEALIADRIDAAVHSLKDLPAALPEGLLIGAYAKRHDPRDALLSNRGLKLAELPPGSAVGTGSLRRAAQILHAYPELRIKPIRGNVDTRIRKLRESGDYDAIVLAAAGLERMGMTGEASEILPVDTVLPAPGQGIVAVECRAGDENSLQVLSAVDYAASRYMAVAERGFLSALSGDCNVPAGAYSEVDGGRIEIRALIASPDGKKIVSGGSSGKTDDSDSIGRALARSMLRNGGGASMSSF